MSEGEEGREVTVASCYSIQARYKSKVGKIIDRAQCCVTLYCTMSIPPLDRYLAIGRFDLGNGLDLMIDCEMVSVRRAVALAK